MASNRASQYVPAHLYKDKRGIFVMTFFVLEKVVENDTTDFGMSDPLKITKNKMKIILLENTQIKTYFVPFNF